MPHRIAANVAQWIDDQCEPRAVISSIGSQLRASFRCGCTRQRQQSPRQNCECRFGSRLYSTYATKIRTSPSTTDTGSATSVSIAGFKYSRPSSRPFWEARINHIWLL
ncbi:hypothetical protein FRC12_006469 [Ceratobasidium sp. 428]|nr:hypothetical protein FRC12_006469 [Ceratobasidium sp. 428]